MATTRRTTVFLDRIEGSRAVLVLADGTEVDVPRGLLPPDAAEGDVLAVSVAVDPEETRRRRRSAQDARDALGSDDDGGDLTL